MTKHGRLAVLIALLLTAGAAAWASWLNFHRAPVTDPDAEADSARRLQAALDEAMARHSDHAGNSPAPTADNGEQAFMASQLRRVLEGGDSRTATEKAIAALLPENPDVGDLRQAYLRHRLDVQAAQATAFMAAYPEYAADLLPPQDKEARAAFDEAVKIAEKVKERAGQDYRPGTAWQSTDPNVRAALLEETAPLMPLLAKAIPAEGKTLVTRQGPGDVDLVSSRPVKIATARARLLLAEGQNELAVETLKNIHRYCCAELSPPTLMDCLFRQVYFEIFYQDGVFAFARAGRLSAKELAAFSDRASLPEYDPIRSARIELRQLLDFFTTTDLGKSGKLAATSLLTKGDFNQYGATSLDDWVRREANVDVGGHWKATAEFITQVVEAGIDVRNLEGEKADQFLVLADSEPRKTSVRAMGTCAESRAHIEAYLFAARLYELRLAQPGDWRKRAEAEVLNWPLLEAMDTGNQVIIRQNGAQALLRKRGSNDGIVSVP